MKDSKVIGYTLLRTVMGINMLMHGAVRLLGDYSGFVEGVTGQFSGTMLPPIMARAVAWSIPPLEFLVGLSLILGLATGIALLVAGLLMGVLVFGMSLLQNWGTVADQMVYTVLFALLLFGLDYNRFSLDSVIGNSS